ncbi:MAG: FtsX-like permease family protein [Candidatus Atribacteria bacterium]|nr:MAG: FtsX-like permease family protein [Candidatus Atribacteria bacterium]
MTRRVRRPGQWIAMTAVALATAVLFVAFGLQQAVEDELAALLEQIGANVFYFYLEDHTPFDDEDRATITALPEVELAAGEGSTSSIRDPRNEYSLTYMQVSDGYLELMRLPLSSGEAFSSESQQGVVLGAEVARVVFGDSDPVGQEIDDLPIVGVLEAISEDDTIRSKLNRRILTPVGMAPRSVTRDREAPYWALWARPSGSVDDAIQAIQRVFPDMHTTYAAERYERAFTLERQVNRILLAASFGLFLLAATIVSGTLTLASLSDRREIGIRVAVGAQGRNIMGLLARDALSLVLGAGIAGIALGLIAFLFANVWGISLRLGGIHLAIIPLLCLLGLVSSLVPGWQSARLSPVRAMSARGLDQGRHRKMAAGFVVVAVSAALGACALYLFLFMGTAADTALGNFIGEVDDRTFVVSPPKQSILYPPRFTADDALALELVPGIESVVTIGSATSAFNDVPELEGHTVRVVGEGYADLQLLPILAGRDLTAAEISADSPVAILSSDAAFRLFGEDDPLGQTVVANAVSYTVFGVFTSAAVAIPMGTWMVVPYGSFIEPVTRYGHVFWVHVSPEVDLESTSESIRQTLRQRHPGRADAVISTPDAAIAETRALLQGISYRLALLIAVALFLAAANTFNLIRFHLALQRRELGIRRAVGAVDLSIMWFGGKQGLRIAVVATALGLCCGVLSAGLLRTAMSLTSTAVSPAHLAIASAVIIGLGLLAGGVAGWMATRGSPADALRKGRE